MASTDFSHGFLGTTKFWAQKNHFMHPPLCWFLATFYVRTTTMTTYKTRCGGLAWGWHWRSAKSARLFFIVPQIIMYCHRFTLNGSFCMLIYAGTCNIFVILTPRSNSGIKKELIAHFLVFLANYQGVPPNFGSQKMKILLFLSDQLMPISSFTLKGFISAVPDLLGHFLITKTGGLRLSVTVCQVAVMLMYCKYCSKKWFKRYWLYCNSYLHRYGGPNMLD